MVNGLAEKPKIEYLLDLTVSTINDCAALCDLEASSVYKDVKRLFTRLSHEGVDVLTKHLPMLGKCLDKALGSNKHLAECCDHSFAISKKSGLPIFLGAFFRIIFSDSFVVRDDEGRVTFSCAFPGEVTQAQVKAVRAVRQICYLFYKLEGSHTRESELQTIEDFVLCDSSLPEEGAEVTLSPRTLRAMEIARIVLSRALEGVNLQEIIPRHGPGAVATGEKNHQKMNFRRFFGSIDQVYPYSDYFFYSYTHLCDSLEDLEEFNIEQTSTAKVVLVPKDSRGPRLISMEPLEMQWIQQGILRSLVNHLESKGCARGQVNFTDQSINRELARDSSHHDPEYDTLDMKEASDRVSAWLVRELFPEHICKYIFAARSTHTQLPDGRVVELRKFAPMGSAICFPIEALTFWALAVGALHTHTFFSSFSPYRGCKEEKEVYVYGDDLIVPHGTLEVIRPVFEELYLKFNEDKCCTGRYFKESCGLDAFNGEDVSPVRCKTQWDTDLSPAAFLSWVDLSNRFHRRGLFSASRSIRSALNNTKFGPVPQTNRMCRALPGTFYYDDWDSHRCAASLLHDYKSRYNKRLHRREVRILQPCVRTRMYGEPNWSEMLRLFTEKGGTSLPFSLSPSYLGPCRYTVPHSISMRWRWVALDALLA